MDKLTISLYYDRIYPWLNILNNEQLGALFRAITFYFLDETDVELEDPMTNTAFKIIKVDMDNLIQHRRKISKSMAENGKKSGEARRKKTEEPTQNSGILPKRIDVKSPMPSTYDLNEISRKRRETDDFTDDFDEQETG